MYNKLPRHSTTSFFALLGLLAAQSLLAKPNILLIYTDDHGWPDIGAVGIYEDLKTPHIDALAASGVRATSGYSTAPQCVPSRAGLLIGKAQSRFGVESNASPLEGFGTEQTIAERLKQAGYATGQVGKWHLGPAPAIPSHGFDDVYSKNANRPCYANFTLEGKTIPMQQVNDKLYHLDACSEAALSFIDRHADKPWFLYLAYRAPHVPLDAPQKYLDRFPGDMPERRRQCLAMLSSMDDGIGKIRADLKQRGQLENTLIFYIGDNGAPLKIHKADEPGGGPGWDGSLNEPMNGEKGMLAEGGIRVPFLVSWPGTIPANQVVDTPLISLDVAATAVAASRLAAVPELDGRNIVPLLCGEAAAPKDPLYWRWVAQAAVRDGKWKLLRGGKRSYLYDLDTDPGEKENLFANHPEVAKRLTHQLEKWAEALNPPGLQNAVMSPTWERYFDHYLDGKNVAPPETSKASSEGWVVRNGSIEMTNQGLKITQSKKEKHPPFIAFAKLKLQGPVEVEVLLSSEQAGRLGVAWRSKEQSDFVSDQVVYTALPQQPDWQTAKIVVPAKGQLIHARILLPPGNTIIKRISFKGADGKRQQWKFMP